MLTDQEKKALLHFTHSPSVFIDSRLKSLASSITHGRINPTTREDAVKCIILHAESIQAVLNHKKVTATILLKYLNELNVPAPGNSSKEILVDKILYSEWKFPPPIPSQNSSISITGQNNICSPNQIGHISVMNNGNSAAPGMNTSLQNYSNMLGNQPGNLPPWHYSHQPTTPYANCGQVPVVQYPGQHTQNSIPSNNSLQMYNNPQRPGPSPLSDTLASRHLLKEVNSLAFDDFMVNFAKMFYELLNNPSGIYLHGLNESHFFEECKMVIQIKGEEEDIEQTGESVIDVLKLLSDLRRDHQLAFNPNLTPEGVRGKTDSHGLIYAVASGTLHHGPGKLVGVYEQSFILRKDPFEQNSCKIADSTLVLRSNNSVNAFSQLLLPASGRSNERNPAIRSAPSSDYHLQLTYPS